MKKLFCSFVFCILIFCSGCEQKTGILFDSEKITNNTIYKRESTFLTHQKINYVIIDMRQFKDEKIRVQLIKKYKNSAFWGYSRYYSKDIRIDKSKKYYIDYVVVNDPGYYVMQVFYYSDREKAFAKNDFW